ncbi:MAG: exodeoxyribonuclease VII small subunit, partial [Akkermansiaceae bacterium]
ETMDSGQIPLEKLIANYERGATLITHCEEVLLNAKKRLELITLTPSPTTKDEDTTQSNNHDEAAASDDSNDDEIRLF